MLVCKNCGPLPRNRFYTDRRRGQPYTFCKTCWMARVKRWKVRNLPSVLAYQRTAARRRSLRIRYGIDPDQYDAMYRKQKGLCAICRRPERSKYKGKIRRLAVDHDHKTGRVRALLCAACNAILAAAGDSPRRLTAAVRYLRRWVFRRR